VPERTGDTIGSRGKLELRTLRLAEIEMTALARDENALRAGGRQAFGIAGRRERIPFGPAMKVSGCRWQQAVTLWAVTLADSVAAASIVGVGPAARVTLGAGALGPFVTLRPLFFAVGAVIALVLLKRYPGRAAAARYAITAVTAGLVAAALATSTVVLFVAAVATAVASGALAVVVLPLLFDSYRPEVRLRVIGAYVAAVVAGVGLALLVRTVAEGTDLTWRSSLLILAFVPVASAIASLSLTDPPPPGFETARIHRMVEKRLGGAGGADAELSAADVALTVTEQLRRVAAPRSAPAALVLAATFGVFLWGMPSALDVFMRDRWGLAEPSRALQFASLCLATLPAILWYSGKAEVAFRRSPRDLMQLTTSAALIGAVALGAATVLPLFAATAVLLWVAFSAIGALMVSASFLLVSLCDPRQRGYAGAMLGTSVVAGGVVATLLINTIGSRFGVEWALVAISGILLGAASTVGRRVAELDADVDGVAGRILENHDLAVRVGLGHHLPLLSCRHLDFSYGQVQVLFDVSFTVDDGEMVALLGTNGAGKSTLLRVISGLALPSAGSLHYRGSDITYLGTDRRVALGISQIPGGRAVFGPLTVTDNLRAYGHTLGRSRSELERGIEAAFDALPRLEERRAQLASTLSGGEQQMLALAKAFILRPRLLLIDELSLGLAPKVVGELLDMVKRVNASGTAVVLVEQSVNVALSLVDHAYFMEKGEIRFDGPAGQLMERPDLLRSVFLEGAAKGMQSAAKR
jgi:ABC-type branched-subunit amino acid transport system ATPase component/MFS family permease